MRVLILAHDCNPEWASLPIVGYKASAAIARRVECVIATHVRNEALIRETHTGPGEFAFIDNEYIAAPMYKLAQRLRGGNAVAWTTNIAMAYPAYLAFEREVWKRFGADLRAGRFDLVHRVTPMSPTLPSWIAKRCPVPFVLGPLNGGLRWPAAYREELRSEKEWLSYLRRAHRLLPYYASTYRSARAILGAFTHTIEDLPVGCRSRAIDFPEVGIDPALFAASPEGEARSPDVLFAGRLVPYKCPDVIVQAFAASESLRRRRLLIVGDGPERPRLEAMIREHGLAGCVELLGWRSQAEVGRLMRRCSVFAFPSIRELGAGAVVEAMGCGLACVVVDYGGPGGLVGIDRGVKVPLAPKPALVESFAREVAGLLDEPERAARLGSAAREFVRSEYTWDAKAEKTLEVYRWVLGQEHSKPIFIRSAPQPGRGAAA